MATIMRLRPVTLCRLTVRLAPGHCFLRLPKGSMSKLRRHSKESLLLITMLRMLWRLTYQHMHGWPATWCTLAGNLRRSTADQASLFKPS